jgi:asparagine N-glycosylation enzyme membrane subunit Stt3
MKLAERLPEGLRERLAPRIKQAETFVREWEWTWTRAVITSLILWFIGIGVLAILPSWWLYFADQTQNTLFGWHLGWRPCPCPDAAHFWLNKLRDVIASGLFGTPFLLFIVVPLLLQKWRRRLRGESEARPTGGYR